MTKLMYILSKHSITQQTCILTNNNITQHTHILTNHNFPPNHDTQVTGMAHLLCVGTISQSAHTLAGKVRGILEKYNSNQQVKVCITFIKISMAASVSVSNPTLI